tara:strand:- start:3184 stop:7581 length:4398 start_codon:yes stop_codon:yes gene_type:complete
MAKKRVKYNADLVYNGSRLTPVVQRRLEALQNAAVKDKFGYSKFTYNEGSGNQSMEYREAFQNRNFDGNGELSSRKPWVRMWTAIQPYELKEDTELTEKAIADKKIVEGQAIYASEPKYIQIYEVGNSTWSDYMEGLKTPGTSIEESTEGGTSPAQWLSNNPFGKPGVSVNSVRSANLGSDNTGTHVKETTVDFTVFNMADYENIVLPYFLRPAAEVFVDYGWDTAQAYPRQEHLKKKELLEKIYSAGDGYLDEAKGDMEVIYGLVSDFTSNVRPDGGWNCSVTITSSNLAIIDFNQKASLKLGPLFGEEINRTLVRYWNNALGVKFSPSQDNIFNITDDGTNEGKNNPFLQQSLFMLKARNNKRAKAPYTREGITFYPFEVSDAEFDVGIAFQPFRGIFNNKGAFKPIQELHVTEDALNTKRKMANATQETAESYFNSNFSDNIFVSFKWLEQFLNKNVGFESKEGGSTNLEFDFSSQICSWNNLIYSKQNLLRFMPKGYNKDGQQLDKFMTKSNMRGAYSESKWFLPATTYKYSEYDDFHYVKKRPGSLLEGFTSVGNIFMNLKWLKEVFKKKDDFRKALKTIAETINEESFGILRFRFFSGGADTRIVLVDTNVPAYTRDRSDKDCEKLGGLYCIDELMNKSAGNNKAQGSTLNTMDADAHANLFAFSVQSPNSIVYDAQLTMNIQNSRLKNDLMLRTMPAGKPLTNPNMGWSESMVLKDLLTHVSYGNVNTKGQKIEKHYDYLPGFTEQSTETAQVNEFSVSITEQNEEFVDPTSIADFSYNALNEIYGATEVNYEWRHKDWEDSSASENGSVPVNGECKWHTVLSGQTLGRIARMYNTTWQKIVEWNKEVKVAPGKTGIPSNGGVNADWVICVSDPGVAGTHKSQQANVGNEDTGSQEKDLNASEPEKKPATFDGFEKEYHSYTIKDTQQRTFYTSDPIEYFNRRLKEPIVWQETLGDVRVPIDLNMHVYGTAGIYPQNIFSIDYLPRAYFEKVYFRVIKVEQIVTSTGWKTGIQGAMMFKDAAESLRKSAKGKSTNNWLATSVHFTDRGLQSMGYTNDDITYFGMDQNEMERHRWFEKQPGFAARSYANYYSAHQNYGDDKECAEWDNIRKRTDMDADEIKELLKMSEWEPNLECYWNDDAEKRNVCLDRSEEARGPNGVDMFLDKYDWICYGQVCEDGHGCFDAYKVCDGEKGQGKKQIDVNVVRRRYIEILEAKGGSYNSCCDPEQHPEHCNEFNQDMCFNMWEKWNYLDQCVGPGTVADLYGNKSTEDPSEGESKAKLYNGFNCTKDSDCRLHGWDMLCDKMRTKEWKGCCETRQHEGWTQHLQVPCSDLGLAVCRPKAWLDHPKDGGYGFGLQFEPGIGGCLSSDQFGPCLGSDGMGLGCPMVAPGGMICDGYGDCRPCGTDTHTGQGYNPYGPWGCEDVAHNQMGGDTWQYYQQYWDFAPPVSECSECEPDAYS